LCIPLRGVILINADSFDANGATSKSHPPPPSPSSFLLSHTLATLFYIIKKEIYLDQS
jgi:hypothetical protein